MTMIDEILEKGLGHEAHCNSRYEISGGLATEEIKDRLTECTCGADKRRKYLERLKEPTEEMLLASEEEVFGIDQTKFQVRRAAINSHKAMLAKAEEGL